ncbi:MAG: hypothetical protein WEC75_10235 [Dehalococcoidia bacterium]
MSKRGASEAARYNRRFVERARASGWRDAYLIPERHPCPPCLVAARSYPLDDLPETPLPECQKPEGCACWFAALLPATAAAPAAA